MPLHSFLAFKSPALATLIPTLLACYGIQAAVAVPSIIFQTEKYYDLSGSLTFLGCTAMSLYLPTARLRSLAASQGLPKPAWPSLLSFPIQKLVLSAMVTIWACRLGSFLFERIVKHGRDSRFDEIKKSPAQFAGAFFAQATWVASVAGPIFAVNALPNDLIRAHAAARGLMFGLSALELAGALTWLAGFAFEVTADRQKSAWRADKDSKRHNEKFISSGLWALSRHPNYFGESLLWTGTALTALPLLTSTAVLGSYYPISRVAATGLTFLSPVFVTLLTNFVSGTPMLEKKAAEKYGAEWQKYCDKTPIFFPKLP